MDIPRSTPGNRRRWMMRWAVGAALILVTVAVSRLEPASPTVDRATIWTDSVQRGTMVRQVRGPGTLVPEQIRFISAVTAGRVERVLAQPGMQVEAGTPLLELSNPDVARQTLEAERQLAAADSELLNMRATLENQRLGQESAVETARSAHRDAERQLAVREGLAREDLIPRAELAQARDQAAEARERFEIEQKRLRFLAQSMDAQLAGQRSQVDRLRGLTAFQREQAESMRVRAGTMGVLRELPLQEGQWVTPGQNLAVVVQPGRLKAELRIPEIQARDLAVGQLAAIDTRNGVVPGRVIRIAPAVQNGTVTVDVALEGPLPRGARPDLSVDGTIEIERLTDVLQVGRPAYGQAESTVGLFRVEPGGRSAVRTSVALGRSSVNTIEVRGGLRPGDVVILSDMSQWDSAERVRLQ